MKVLSGEEKVPSGYCVSCSKNFSTVMALENHKKSKKHLDAAKAFNQREDRLEVENNRLNRRPAEDEAEDDEMVDDDDEDVEEVSSDEWDEDEEGAIAPNDCLFCEHHSANIDKVTRNNSCLPSPYPRLLQLTSYNSSNDQMLFLR